jgi:hypothetical protein
VGKALTDAGAGVNSDLIAAMEWAALPADTSPTGCSVGAQVVNMSLGSEAQDVDRPGSSRTAWRCSMGRSSWRPPATAAPSRAACSRRRARPRRCSRSVRRRRTTTSSTTTRSRASRAPAGRTTRRHRTRPCTRAATASPARRRPPRSHRSPRAALPPSGSRPDVVAPGYNIVSAQAVAGTAIAIPGRQPRHTCRPLLRDGVGTSMATPAASEGRRRSSSPPTALASPRGRAAHRARPRPGARIRARARGAHEYWRRPTSTRRA